MQRSSFLALALECTGSASTVALNYASSRTLWNSRDTWSERRVFPFLFFPISVQLTHPPPGREISFRFSINIISFKDWGVRT